MGDQPYNLKLSLFVEDYNFGCLCSAETMPILYIVHLELRFYSKDCCLAGVGAIYWPSLVI